MGKRLIAVSATLGLLIGLVAGVLGAGLAGAETPPGSQSDLIFFPWVPNGETLNTSSPWYGAIVVQNLESVPINVELGRSAGGVFPVNVIVQPHAAYTFSSADLATELGWTGNGGGVVAAASWLTSQLPSTICQAETGSISVTRYPDRENLPSGITKTADVDYLAGLPLGATVTAISQGGTTYAKGDDWTQQGNLITWTSVNRPANGTLYTVEYTTAACTRGPQIGGVEKQAAPTAAGFTVSTNSSMTSVDGYTAIPDTDVAWGVSSTFCQDANPSGVCNNLGSYVLGWPVGGFDGTSYLPIVQGNYSGWDTYLHVTNIDASTVGSSQVTITYYRQGQGVGNQGSFVEQFSLAAGESKTFNLANDAPAGFVGSAWITAQNGIVVSASRVKGTMALTNTNVPSVYATTSPDNSTKDHGSLGVDASCTAIDGTMCQLYAPLVYLDYNGWNTGFNLVNTSEYQNQVTINVVNRDGTSVGVYTTAIPPKGMQYVYIPAGQDQGLGQGDFTAAILTANAPFNATVDEVKYSTGEAMSYNATATLAVADNGTFTSAFFGNALSLPLYQAGTVTNGISHGDTSGINLFNPTGNSVSGRVDFYMSTGAAAGSTQIGGGTPFTIGAMGSALVAYAPSQANITPGSQLSAVVTVTSGKGGVVGVSNEVNYDVNGDGGVVFNMLNLDGQYRYACSQTSCGSPVPPVTKFASKLTLQPATQSHLIGADATVIATAYDADGNPMPNVAVTLTISSNGSPSVTTPVKQKTDANGQVSITYTNTQVGTDHVSATAKAPNGGTLKSVPPTVDVIWTQPVLHVTVCTVTDTGCFAEPGDGTPGTTTTVTGTLANDIYIGSWKYTFTVTNVGTPSDLDSALLHFTPVFPGNYGSVGSFSKGQLDGTAWSCTAGTCTATVTNTDFDLTGRIGKSEVLNWYLDVNGNGTQDTGEPSADDNPTTVNYVAPQPQFQGLVDIQEPEQEESIKSNDVSTTATDTGFNSTINADDFTDIMDADGHFTEVYQFTYTDPAITDLSDCTTLLAGAKVHRTAGTGSEIFTATLDYIPSDGGTQYNGAVTTWAYVAPSSCQATVTYQDASLSDQDTSFQPPKYKAGSTKIDDWQLELSSGTKIPTDATTNATTIHYPDHAPDVRLDATAGSGTGQDWNSSLTVLPDNGDEYGWSYRFVVTGYPDCSLVPTTVDWVITSGYQANTTGSFTNLTWTYDSALGCVAITTSSTGSAASGLSSTGHFTLNAVNPDLTVPSPDVTVSWQPLT